MNSSTLTPASTTRTDNNFNMRDMILKFGLTQTEILEAVKAVGADKAKVEAYLATRK